MQDTPNTSSSVPLLQQLKAYDARRPSFPGEHWLVLGAGLAVMMASRRSPSFWRRTAGSALGSALLYRAASGRDGLSKALRYLPARRTGLR